MARDFENKNDIFELMERFEKSSLSELEISFGTDINIKFSKLSKHTAAASDAVYIPKPKETAAAPEKSSSEKIITAPLVGTFYIAPSPESEPYVQPGDKISKGMVLCIIEAMKTMNEIESEIDGEIAEILAVNGEPVEFAQPLFKIKQ